MSGSGSIRLVVRGDDFGMCHAVNEGIKLAFAAEVVTDPAVKELIDELGITLCSLPEALTTAAVP
jgi:YdjC-like protein